MPTWDPYHLHFLNYPSAQRQTTLAITRGHTDVVLVSVLSGWLPLDLQSSKARESTDWRQEQRPIHKRVQTHHSHRHNTRLARCASFPADTSFSGSSSNTQWHRMSSVTFQSLIHLQKRIPFEEPWQSSIAADNRELTGTNLIWGSKYSSLTINSIK